MLAAMQRVQHLRNAMQKGSAVNLDYSFSTTEA